MKFLQTFRTIMVKTEEELPSEKKLSFIKARKEIKKEILKSKENQNVVGIYADALGDGMFLCCVDDLFAPKNEEVVVLKPYDMNGILLQRNELALSEIRAVCPLDFKYQNPLF